MRCKRLRYICKCKECGNEAFVDDTVVLMTDPPKYNYYCTHCGEHGYVFCEDVEVYIEK